MNQNTIATDSVLFDLSEYSVLGELTELRIPEHRRSSEGIVGRVERRFDHLVDLLAAEQTGCGTHGDRLQATSPNAPPPRPIEVSVVVPCLNHGETIGNCVLKAFHALERHGLAGEVIVADNGSRDDSVEIAEELGARVVHVEDEGYGAALRAGVLAARGPYIFTAEADDSYDFGGLGRFYEHLRTGTQLVQGCRLRSGGGRILPGAMAPWRQLGHRLFSFCVARCAGLKTHDLLCPVRAFTRQFAERYLLHRPDVELGFEFVLASDARSECIAEEAIKLQPPSRPRKLQRRFQAGDLARVARLCCKRKPLRFALAGAVAVLLACVCF